MSDAVPPDLEYLSGFGKYAASVHSLLDTTYHVRNLLAITQAITSSPRLFLGLYPKLRTTPGYTMMTMLVVLAIKAPKMS